MIREWLSAVIEMVMWSLAPHKTVIRGGGSFRQAAEPEAGMPAPADEFEVVYIEPLIIGGWE